MIILSVGMPRAGSGWYYNLTNDLIVAAGFQDGHSIRQRYRLQKILTEVNCNIGALTPRRLGRVLIPSLAGNTFVIKAHSRPTAFARWLIRHGWMQAAYIYRDPRDAMLSAFENGQKARENGRPNAFSRLVDFETSLKFIEEYSLISQAWIDTNLVHHTRFEDFLSQYEAESESLSRFLHLDANAPPIRKAIDKNQPARTSQSDQRGIHFSKGKTGRYRQKYSEEQQTLMSEQLATTLEKLGYELT